MNRNGSDKPVREIYLGALDIEDDAERRAFLDEACGVDTDRRRQVERYLSRQVDGGSSPLDQAVNRLAPTDVMQQQETVISVADTPMIGPYKIREQIGEGGFGVVYVADQTEPVQRRVALKIIKPGMDTKEVIARFQAEQQALAMMDHPHIAKVFDAGTTDTGRPYFVMELIRGMPITQYCREKKLDLPGRLKLFIDVCKAVQHAHQKGIIHRDLKPSNILITLHDGIPVVKVIDFGVAKALSQKLTAHTVYTRHAQMIGTPVYMSPEQAELSGLDIDTRSDVYSLGVLLYELLTGTTPFDQESLCSKGFDEMRRIIREDDPPRPSHRISTLDVEALSTLQQERGLNHRDYSHLLKRELDWIVMKTLEKDRERRYESANALAADVQRYLDDEAVLACPPTVGYRLKKYLKKYRGQIVTAGVLLTILFTSTVISAIFAVEAVQARDEANEQKGEAIAARDLADERLASEQQARQETEQERERAEQNFAAALDAVEKLLTHIGNPDLAEIPELQDTYEKILNDTLAFYDLFIQKHGNSPKLEYRATLVLEQLARLAGYTQRFSEGAKAYAKAIILVDRLVEQAPDLAYRERQAEVYRLAGQFHKVRLVGEGTEEIALRYLQRAETLYEVLSLLEPGNKHYATMRAFAICDQADLHWLRAPSDLQVMKQRKDAYNLAYRLKPDPLLITILASQLEANDEVRAKKLYVEARSMIQKSPATFEEVSRHIWALQRLILFFETRDTRITDELYRKSLELAQQTYRDFPNRIKAEQWLGGVLHRYLRFLKNQDRMEDAKKHFERLTGELPNSFRIHRVFSEFLLDSSHREESIRDLTTHIKLYPAVPFYYHQRGILKSRIGDLDGALSDLNRADDLAKTGFPRHGPLYRRAEIHIKRHQYEKAVDDINTALKFGNVHLEELYEIRALALFHLQRYEESFQDLRTALVKEPGDFGIFATISPQEIANCPDTVFRTKYLKLLDKAVSNRDLTRARTTRAAIRIIFEQKREALTDLECIIERGEGDYYSYYQVALLTLHLGERGKYQNSCRSMLGAFKDSTEPKETHFTAWTCALTPNAISDYEPAIKLAKHAVSENPENQQYLDGLGATLMRAGQYDEAKSQLEKALRTTADSNTSSSYVRYFLAMTEHHLGNQKAAEEQLLIANAAAEQEIAGGPAWNRKLTLELLRKEAEALIGKRTNTKRKPAVAVPSSGR